MTGAQIAALAAELSNDPLGRGYSGMSDVAAAASLNAVDRQLPRESMAGDEVFAATDSGEWGSATDGQRNMWLAFCGRATIDPFGAANVDFVTWLFGSGSATVAALVAARQRDVSRAEELGLPSVAVGHVEQARGA